MGNFIINQLGRLIIGSTYGAFGYAWGVGSIEFGTFWWFLYLFATAPPASVGFIMVRMTTKRTR